MDDQDAVLPIVPLVVGAAPAGAGRPPTARRWLDAVIGYLPLLLMGLLALATWWLVKNTPAPPVERPVAPLRHEPDYEMRQFSVRRFGTQGPAHRVVEGERLRHFPDTDTLEIDQVRVLWTDDDGARMIGTARHAVSNADASQVELIGEAMVRREGGAAAPTEVLEFRGEYLRFEANPQRVFSPRPITLVQGGSRLEAGSLDYRQDSGTILLGGPVRGRLAPLGETP